MLRSLINRKNENTVSATAIYKIVNDSVIAWNLSTHYTEVLAMIVTSYAGQKIDWKHVSKLVKNNGLLFTNDVANAINWALAETVKYSNNQKGY